MLTSRSIAFAIPGALLGLLMAALAYLPVAAQLSSFTGADISAALDGNAMLVGIGLAVALPLLANWPASTKATVPKLHTMTGANRTVALTVLLNHDTWF